MKVQRKKENVVKVVSGGWAEEVENAVCTLPHRCATQGQHGGCQGRPLPDWAPSQSAQISPLDASRHHQIPSHHTINGHQAKQSECFNHFVNNWVDTNLQSKFQDNEAGGKKYNFPVLCYKLFSFCFIQNICTSNFRVLLHPRRLTTLRYSYFLNCFHNVHFIKGLKENALYL